MAGLTTSGQNMVMKELRIAALKARLSESLRSVRQGDAILMLTAVILAGTGRTQQPASLIVNGSFEDGPAASHRRS